MILRKPVPHKEAAALIRGKPVVSRQVFKELLPELKGRAFAIAGIEYAGVAQDIRDRLAELPEGALWDDVKKDVADDLVPYMVDPDTDKEMQDKQLQAAFRKAELLLRIHGFQAYHAAAWQVMDRQREVLPYWQYHSMEDARVRPSHAALDGLILPADSPFWRDHFPPWEWGCRCLVTPVSEEDAKRIQGEDADRNPEDRRFMDGNALRKLEEEGALIRNSGAFNVTSGHAQGDKGAFFWDPATLRIPVKELKARYDAATWAGFEKIARATPLQKGQDKTVWDWLNEGPKVPKGTKAKKGEQTSGSTPSTAPVSAPLADRNVVLNVATSIEDKPREVFVLLEPGPNGLQEKYPRHTSGLSGGDLPKDWDLRGCTFVHNHPSGVAKGNKGFGSSFSTPDIQTLINTGLQEIAAASPKRVYRMRAPAKMPDKAQIDQAFNNAFYEVRKKLNFRLNQNLTSIWAVDRLTYHLVWKRFAKDLGFEYIVERRK